MLGHKALQAKMLYDFSLENAVPPDDFYRKLEKAVDLSWVRPRVAPLYASIGRPSVDPEVIVKIELIGYLEGILFERQLMRQIADRLSLRRYIGYDLDEAVPDHSTLSKARNLLGHALFHEIFDHSVRLCQAAGMVGGVHVSGDKSLVQANASLDSLEPRVVPYTPRSFVERLFAENPVVPTEDAEPASPVSLTDHRDPFPTLASSPAPDAPRRVQPRSCAAPAPADETGETPPAEQIATPPRTNATHVSRTDPDATLVARSDVPLMLAYNAEVWTDSRAGVIVHADAATGALPEHVTVPQALDRQQAVFGLPLVSIALDKSYGRGRLYRHLDAVGVRGFIPHPRQVNSQSGPGLYPPEQFVYEAERGVYVCPAGTDLHYAHLKIRWPSASHVWRAKREECAVCGQRAQCTKARDGRSLQISLYQAEYAAMDARLRGPGARLAAIARKTGPEPRFGQAKRWQGMERAKYRGLDKFRGQVLLTAAAQNLKKYIRWIWRKGQGAGTVDWRQTGRTLTTLLHPLPLCPIQSMRLLTFD